MVISLKKLKLLPKKYKTKSIKLLLIFASSAKRLKMGNKVGYFIVANLINISNLKMILFVKKLRDHLGHFFQKKTHIVMTKIENKTHLHSIAPSQARC